MLVLLVLGCGSLGPGSGGREPPTGPGTGGGSGTGTGGAPGTAQIDPGRVTLHRLNRAEYDNTVRDLLGTSLTPARDFPWDDTSHGFDNIADTLTVSPLHVEMWEQAAMRLAAEAVDLPLADPLDLRIEAESDEVEANTGAPGPDYYNLWSNGDLTAVVAVPEAGRYRMSTRVWADQAGGELAQMGMTIDGMLLDTFEVSGTRADLAEVFAVEADLGAGAHTFTVSFFNDYWNPDLGEDRNLLIDWIEVYGPTDLEPGPNPIRDALFVCTPTGDADVDCARRILGPFLERAWRRPVAPAELDQLIALFSSVVADDGTFDDGIRVALTSALLSPHFLYRVEIDPDPDSAAPTPLGDHELASRLSYFLWSSMPDQELFDAAKQGSLQDPDQLEAQVRRMLADPRSEALVENFAGQWLFIRGIGDVAPDPWVFPGFDEALRASMKEEMTRFFRSFLRGERSLGELLTATEGEIDARLAEHYGLAPVSGWTRVELEPAGRGGLLGQAGLLTVNSYPARTSPVRRGKWVLSNLLCAEPEPPPPGVEGLIEDDADARTLRERLEQHRADPLCASCHDALDPIGFGLEHFDGVGAWRDFDGEWPIDATGEMPGGATFDGARELAAVLAADPRFPDCIAEKLFIYALGRGPVPPDAQVLGAIETAFEEGGMRLDALAVAIARSEAFRMRRGEP